MLSEFIVANHDVIVSRVRARVAERSGGRARDAELLRGVPAFLAQLCEALGQAPAARVVGRGEITASGGHHGTQLHRSGLAIGQTVHDYGDICQVVTELAVEQRWSISGDEYKTLNLCLDDAVAGAVTAYTEHRERMLADEQTEQLGVFAHELRNLLTSATLSFESIRSGRVGPNGRTAEALGRSLMRLGTLVDHSLASVRLEAGIERLAPIVVAELVDEVAIDAQLQTSACGARLELTTPDPSVAVEGDRQILAAALANLLQNAFKFGRAHGLVSLRVRVENGRVLFEVEDECGGLPPGKAETLFEPFEQRSGDRTGLGLGLSISAKAARTHHGDLGVRDLPGKGCIFTLDLPLARPAPETSSRRGAGRSVSSSGGSSPR